MRARILTWRAMALAFVILCGCARQAPPLPAVDASRFQGSVAKAVREAAEGAQSDPNDPGRVMQLCTVLHAHEQYQTAAQCYARANALDPRRFDALYCWAHALASDGNYSAAVQRLREALAVRPDSLPAQLKLAEVLTESGDSARGVALYKSILEKFPDEPRAHFGLGRALGGDQCVPEFQKALVLFPRYGAAQFALAAVYRNSGDQAKATDILRNYERDKLLLPPLNDPEMAAVQALNAGATGMMQRAAAQADEGRLDEAVLLYQRAIEADPKMVRAYADLISLYGRLRRDAEAEGAYRQAIALQPNEADAYYNFGVFCFERGRVAEAKAAFEQTVRLQPRHAEALNNLGAILEQQGNWDGAAGLYRRALDANPSYPLAHFHLGRIYANQKKYELAVAEMERSLEPRTDSTPAYLYALAAVHARAGHRARALELMRDARKEAEARGQTQILASIDRDLAVLERNP